MSRLRGAGPGRAGPGDAGAHCGAGAVHHAAGGEHPGGRGLHAGADPGIKRRKGSVAKRPKKEGYRVTESHAISLFFGRRQERNRKKFSIGKRSNSERRKNGNSDTHFSTWPRIYASQKQVLRDTAR